MRAKGNGCLGGAVLAALLLGAPPVSRALIEGSPHDLVSQGYDGNRSAGSALRCIRCHIPLEAGGGAEQPLPPVLGGLWGEWSLLCFSCHDGTTLVTPEADASLSAFHPQAHGMNLEKYRDRALQLEWPGTQGRRMECVTCHDPHDNAPRPFLRAPLEELCVACHPQSAEMRLGLENLSGSHPIGADPAMGGRPESPIRVGAAFSQPFPSAYPLAGGKQATGVHWNLGGHLTEGADGELTCATCHAIHGDEESPPLPSLLSLEPDGTRADALCEGCHQGRRGDGLGEPPFPNPGGTLEGRTYHPVDDDRSNGEKRIVEIREPKGWPFGVGDPRPLLCTSCHRAHGAWARTPLLRRPEQGGGFCEECHETLPMEYHHPTTGDVTKGCASNLPLAPWSEVPGLSCSSCHRAHNAGLGTDEEKRYVPLLREKPEEIASCTSCHPPGDPTCDPRPEHRASHFLGDATLPETYGDKEPPLRRDPWPESRLKPLYGGQAEREVVCLSCHAFTPGALTSGDTNTGRYLLAKSGNPVEWAEGKEDVYLCTGCHGTSPGTDDTRGGHTHPLMLANGATLTASAKAPVTTTPEGHLNCDSCHRPHRAATNTGYYILELATGGSTDPQTIHPTIDFTVLCQGCHTTDKY